VHFLGRHWSPGHSHGSKRFLGHENPLKMHILSMNFASFTAQIYNSLHMQSKKGDFWHLGGGHGPFGPLNPPMLVLGYFWMNLVWWSSGWLITSAKEVMFLPVFVCLSVCLSVWKITQKVMDGSLCEILRECRAWHKIQVIKFLGWSGRNPGFWVTLEFLLPLR